MHLYSLGEGELPLLSRIPEQIHYEVINTMEKIQHNLRHRIKVICGK